jgi:hypothetical protein
MDFTKYNKSDTCLDFSNKSIQSINENSWKDFKLPNVKIINLSNNEITFIDFKGFPDTVEKVYLADNKLDVLDFKGMNPLSKLEFIDVRHNQIKEIIWLNSPKTLKICNFQHNLISSMNWIDSPPFLLECYFSDNNITAMNWIECTSTLQKCSVSRNKIIDMNWINSPSLKVMHLYRNCITVMNWKSFPKTLKELYLGKNKIQKMEWVDIPRDITLEKLYLSSNEITEMHWKGCPTSLEVCCLKENKITTLSLFNLSHFLKILNVNSNQIKEIQDQKDFFYCRYLDIYIKLNFINQVHEKKYSELKLIYEDDNEEKEKDANQTKYTNIVNEFHKLELSSKNHDIISNKIQNILGSPTNSSEYRLQMKWLNYAINFPWNKRKELPEFETSDSISNYLYNAYCKLNEYIHNMNDVKIEILSIISKRISNPDCKDNLLCLEGNNGVGKTRIASALSITMDLPMRTLNMGTIADASTLIGHDETYSNSDAGLIVRILNQVCCKNCILYIDELDKIHGTPKGNAIMSVLTHLLDPSQNSKFNDVFMGNLDFDLSNVFFIISLNDKNVLSKTLQDRLNIINVPDPSISDKFEISKKFIIPEICKNLGTGTIDISDTELMSIVKQDDNVGLRSIKSRLDTIICRKNMLGLLNDNHKRLLEINEETTRNVKKQKRNELSYYI